MLIPIIVIVALIVVALFAVVAHTDPSPPKLGWMSEQWLAEHRASRAP